MLLWFSGLSRRRHVGCDVFTGVGAYPYPSAHGPLGRYDNYFEATVVGYDAARKLHWCAYADLAQGEGGRQWHDLTRKRLRVLAFPSSGADPHPAHPTSAYPAAGPAASTVAAQTAASTGAASAGAMAMPPGMEGVRVPPSIFGLRPLSAGPGSARQPLPDPPHSANGRRPLSRAAVADLLKDSPYHADATAK
jgi:hypothetical protein